MALNGSNCVVNINFTNRFTLLLVFCSPASVIIAKVATLGLLPVPSLFAIIAHALAFEPWDGISHLNFCFTTDALDDTSLVLISFGNLSCFALLRTGVADHATWYDAAEDETRETNEDPETNVKNEHAAGFNCHFSLISQDKSQIKYILYILNDLF